MGMLPGTLHRASLPSGAPQILHSVMLLYMRNDQLSPAILYARICRIGLFWPQRMPAHSQVTAVQVPQQLREPFLEAVRAGRIRSMQNKLMPAAPIHTPGALLLGDAFNMRHPLTGVLHRAS